MKTNEKGKIKMKMRLVILLLFAGCAAATAQITAGKIVFERKTNLYKKLKHWDEVKERIREEDKIKTDFFDMIFNDTCALFKPQDSDLRDNLWWATNRNTVYQNLRTQKKYVIKTLWGDELHIVDSMESRRWKITESTRKIAGYTCRKAVWQANDSTRIYAWFSYDIVVPVGPETFNGLPGTILGMATEDGGVVYFAKKIEIVKPEHADLTFKKKKKIYSTREVIAELTRQYGTEKWFKRELANNFGVW